ncbi:MAG: hypothetical protein VX589_10375 [Myxococcota bacterium]|nr:hypothetical protein [Myxococcota bacterium]
MGNFKLFGWLMGASLVMDALIGGADFGSSNWSSCAIGERKIKFRAAVRGAWASI